MAVTIQIENNSMAANGWLHVEPDLVVLTSSTSAPQEVDDAIRQFKSSADSPQQDHQTVRALIQRILSATGASSSAVWFPAADEGVGDSHLHLSGSVRVEGVEMGKRFSLSSQGSPHLVVPVVSECEELWIGLAGAERSVEMGRERSSGVFGGSAFLVHPRASGTWNLDSDVSSADAPPVVSERPPAEAQDTPEVSLAPSEESGSDTGDEAEPSSPDEVQPKAGPDPDAPQALDGESFPVSASQPSEPIDDENAKESAPLAASVVTPMGETLLQVPTSRASRRAGLHPTRIWSMASNAPTAISIARMYRRVITVGGVAGVRPRELAVWSRIGGLLWGN